MGKKINIDEKIRRDCDCWLGKITSPELYKMTCYCSLDDKSVRFSVVDNEGITHSKWETLNDAMKDGRKHLVEDFHIWDDIEKRKILIYE